MLELPHEVLPGSEASAAVTWITLPRRLGIRYVNAMHEHVPAFRVEWIDEIGSTNTGIAERLLAEPDLPAGHVLAARRQTAGRGRSQRVWLAPPDVNLTFSVLLRPGVEPLHMVSLPIAAALAVSDALAPHGVTARLKWPNDVQVGGRKIAGMLLDVAAGGSAILGIGLNVNMSDADVARIDQPATSMRMEAGRTFELGDVLAAFLRHFAARYSAWHTGGFEALRADWEQRAEPVGSISSRGEVAGYGPHGELLLRRADGTVEACRTTD